MINVPVDGMEIQPGFDATSNCSCSFTSVCLRVCLVARFFRGISHFLVFLDFHRLRVLVFFGFVMTIRACVFILIITRYRYSICGLNFRTR